MKLYLGTLIVCTESLHAGNDVHHLQFSLRTCKKKLELVVNCSSQDDRNVMSLLVFDYKLKYLTHEIVDLIMAFYGITKSVITTHCMGTLNVHTKFHSNPFNSFKDI